MIVLNPDLRILDINPAAKTLFNETEKTLRLKSIDFLLSNDTILNALEQVEPVILEEEIEISGTRHTFDIRVSPIYFTQKEFLGYLLTLRDISTRKKLEAEREKLINELQDSLTEIKTLSGLLPICSACKKIRDDSGYWHNVEAYVAKHSDAQFSHGSCPDCMGKLYPDFTDK
jgi:PAS domain S-box-containing protein